MELLLIALLLLYVGVLLYLGHLRRQIQILRIQSREAVQEQEAVLSLIDKLGERMTTKLNLTDTLQIITEYIVQATRAQAGAIYVTVEQNGRPALKAEVVIGPFPPLHVEDGVDPSQLRQVLESIRRDSIPFGHSIIGQVAELGEPLLVTDAQADPRVPRNASALIPVHSLILCPLRTRGRTLGVFVVVNKLGQAVFDSRDMAILQALADQASITIDLVKLYDVLADQQRLEQELAVAREFQRMLLPGRFPDLPGYDIHAMSEPAKVVGGDFYDIFEVDRDHVGLVMADVAGKGIPGAMIMAMARAIMRAESRGSLSPKHVLRRVNKRLLENTGENVFITMIYGILHLGSGRLRFVRAGHEPLLIVGDDDRQVRELTPPGIALGMVGEELFEHNEEVEVQLYSGQTVLLYTDGLVEAVNAENVEYGHGRFAEKLIELRKRNSRAMIQGIVEDIHRYTRGTPQNDDITLLALRSLRSAALIGRAPEPQAGTDVAVPHP